MSSSGGGGGQSQTFEPGGLDTNARPLRCRLLVRGGKTRLVGYGWGLHLYLVLTCKSQGWLAPDPGRV